MKNIKKLFATHIKYKGYKIRLPTFGEVNEIMTPIKIKRWFKGDKEREPTPYEMQKRSIELLYKLGVPKQLPTEELNKLTQKLFGGTIK